MKAANKQDNEKEFDFVTKFYGEDLCKEQLKVQLDIRATNLPLETKQYDLHSLLKKLKAMSDPSKILTMPSLHIDIPNSSNACHEHFQ